MAPSPLKDTTQPVDNEEEGRTPTTGRQWLQKKTTLLDQVNAAKMEQK